MRDGVEFQGETALQGGHSSQAKTNGARAVSELMSTTTGGSIDSLAIDIHGTETDCNPKANDHPKAADLVQNGEHSSHTKPLSKDQKLVRNQLERFRQAMVDKKVRNTRWSPKANQQGGPEFDNLFGTSSCTLRQLQFTSYPWPAWVFGALLIMATSIFIHQVHRKALRSPHGESHDWWKYMVGTAVYILAVALMANARVDTVLLSKDPSRIHVRSTKPLCIISRIRRERNVKRELSHIQEVRVEATGEFSGEVDTRCYRICFEFVDGAVVTSLESRSRRKANARCRMIKFFLHSNISASSALASKNDIYTHEEDAQAEQSDSSSE